MCNHEIVIVNNINNRDSNNNSNNNMLNNTKLNDSNLVHAINTKVIPVAAYPMNACKFNGGELKELDQVIKRELRSKNILGKQSSDERLYLRREDAGRAIKSLKDIYKETRLRVACYMVCSENKWIRGRSRNVTCGCPRISTLGKRQRL